jgi:hypothetical protein
VFLHVYDFLPILRSRFTSCAQASRRIAVFIAVVSVLHFTFGWTAAVISFLHVPAFNKGAMLSSVAPGNFSAARAATIASVQVEIDRLNFLRNLFIGLTFLCDIFLYSISFCVFICSIFFCRRALTALLSRLRQRALGSDSITESIEQHSGRMLGLSLWNSVALLLLIISYIIILLGLVLIKAEKDCPGRYEAGPCSR